MRTLLATITTAVILSGCGPSEPPVAGSMTARDLCQTTGYLIRQKLGSNIKTLDTSCTAASQGGNNVLINSTYRTPINNRTIRYYAVGTVNGDRLRIEKIKTEFDKEYTPFHEFP